MKEFNSSKIFPTTTKELKALGWDYADIILITGDAFVDHPSFGSAVIARVLEHAGYRVAIVPQPNWRDDLRDFKKLGQPRLFFGVTAGNMDSMLNHYTANKRLRFQDAYTPGGKTGQRPDYATNVYSNILKDLFPDIPVIIGGIEASMRRFVHYDFWKNRLLTSILESSNADMLCYGMSEKSILQIADRLNDSGQIYNCYDIKQIAYLSDFNDKIENDIKLFSYKELQKDKTKYAENFVKIEQESNYNSNRRIVQNLQNKRLIVNPVFPTTTEKEIDSFYDLDYTRLPHPKYATKEPIPAYEMIKHSVNIHRGCFGGCSFCTISAHQGKFISSRSEKSVLNELHRVTQMPDFKGHITDIGGPSANMYKMRGFDLDLCEKCKKASCIFPVVCKNLDTSHKNLTELYKKAIQIQGIKKVSIGSGIRYDIVLNETNNHITNRHNNEYLELLISKFVSGRLKVAPEHCSPKVLKLMRKTSFNQFQKLKSLFDKINKKYELNQQLIPYFISGHPGCTEIDMAELAIETKDLGFKLEQVQAFTPTPMTLATVMYYTGINPYTNEHLYVAKDPKECEKQLKYFFWYKPEVKKELIKSLVRSGRKDLADKFNGKKK
ncbi:MAG TPA: YgiQ family radical SAM protein [Bacteroidales bacterium]|nr:YgiQ family radical SAM protein [Bacteroidales bacterium]